MRQVRFYSTEEQATSVEKTLARAAGVREVFIYKCRDHDMFMASDEDSGSFLRHKQAGTMFNAVYWATLEIERPEPRVYYNTTKMYSTEQQLLQSRLALGALNAVQTHIYRLTDDEGPVLFVVDQYQGQFMPVTHGGELDLAEYYSTYGQSKLPGPMS